MKRTLTIVPDGPESTAMIDLSAIVMASADNAEGRQRTVIRFAGAASTPFWLEIPFEKFKELMADPGTKSLSRTPSGEPGSCLILMPPKYEVRCQNPPEPGWAVCEEHRRR